MKYIISYDCIDTLEYIKQNFNLGMFSRNVHVTNYTSNNYNNLCCSAIMHSSVVVIDWLRKNISDFYLQHLNIIE